MNAATETRAVREVIALAVRTHGRKRGWHIVAGLLGTTERWVKAATYGEPVAAPDPLIAQAARIKIAQARAAQLLAELQEIEGILLDDDVDSRGQRGPVLR